MDAEALENAWFADRYLSLPRVAEMQLRLAALSYADAPRAEMHLALAKAVAPANPVVLVGEYRYYFYKNRLEDALCVAQKCLVAVAAELKLPGQWRTVTSSHGQFRSDEPAHRFYLFCLKACAYLMLRMQRIDEGRAAVHKLLELDPGNRVGGQVLQDVLDRIGKDDYDD